MSAVPVVYAMVFHALYGQPPGKMAVKVKVVNLSENPIPFTQAVIRSLPQLVPVFMSSSLLISEISPAPYDAASKLLVTVATLVSILYFIWGVTDIVVCLVSDKIRALYDLIAGTVVVRTDADPVSVTSL